MAELCSKCGEKPPAFIKGQSNTLCRECLQEEEAEMKESGMLDGIPKSEKRFLLEMVEHLKTAIELDYLPGQRMALDVMACHIVKRHVSIR